MTLAVRRSPLVSLLRGAKMMILDYHMGCLNLKPRLHSCLLQLAVAASRATHQAVTSRYTHDILFATRLYCVHAAMARVFVLKVGVLPDRVLVPLLNDRMVAKVLDMSCFSITLFSQTCYRAAAAT
jgi:hypothetical protein